MACVVQKRLCLSSLMTLVHVRQIPELSWENLALVVILVLESVKKSLVMQL